MISRTFKTAVCLDAGVAAHFVQNANKFACRLTLRLGNKEVNCKSIMGLVSITVYEGEEITITAVGPGEVEAVETLRRMLAEA